MLLDAAEDEREGRWLLHEYLDSQVHPTTSSPLSSRSRTCVRWTFSTVAVLVTLGVLLKSIVDGYLRLSIPSEELRTNGTHAFKRTVIMVSIDGLRADYLDRGFTPHLFDISQVGLRAEYMQPIFPTITFPTGLFAESHGIVGNNFWDPETQREFVYSEPARSWNASWWKGEPIWEVLEDNGIRTANLMWIGPPRTSRGVTPFYFKPWKNHVSLKEKLNHIMRWIDLPLEERPQLILVYEPSLDQAGHATGPFSGLVNTTLIEVDRFVSELHRALAQRNLSDIVDIIFVSDHGMADTSTIEWLYLEDFIGVEGCSEIEHEDGWPSMGLRFRNESKALEYLEKLQSAAARLSTKFDVYTNETMPMRYHFTDNIRIAPVYVVPKPGYALAKHRGAGNVYSKGNHGFDNQYPAMRAIFVADGPFVRQIKQKRGPLLGGQTWVIDGFPNIEVKGLIARLFNVSLSAGSHNGTDGFWDKYL